MPGALRPLWRCWRERVARASDTARPKLSFHVKIGDGAQSITSTPGGPRYTDRLYRARVVWREMNIQRSFLALRFNRAI